MTRISAFAAQCAAFCAALMLAMPVAADDQPASATPAERPRIGIVLGGGGARGAAHIGVLKELERMRIPVDAIAGTSMGAIIGGLYATGVGADDLQELVNSLDWAAALTDASGRENRSFRRKQDDRAYPINIEVGLRDGDLVLPKGVIHGQKLDLLLRELTFRASHIRNFDDLPIPFRAVASDIVAGEAVVLDGGDLSKAIRASMSVPGVFAPTRIDGRLLVDGGLIGNLPIDVMKTMGVDIIIAVDVEFPLYKSEELVSVLTISEQMLTILIRKETLRQIETLSESDVLIRPELGIFGSTNFGEIAETIQPGVDAVIAQSDGLRPLALSEPDWNDYVSRRQMQSHDAERLAFVRVEHDGKLSSKVLESRLSVEAGDPIDAKVLAQNADRIYGLALYQHVGYQLVEEDGEIGVEYRATAKSWGPNFLQFGIALEDDFAGSTSFNLSTRMTRAGLNRLGAEWRIDLQLGTEPQVTTEFYQPLSFDSRWFVAPRMELQQENLNTFAMDSAIARYRLSEGLFSFDLGRELGTIGEFRVGAFRGAGDARVKIGEPLLPDFDYEDGGVFARLRIDSVDNARFPAKGMLADIEWIMSRPGLGGDFKYDSVVADVAQTWSRGNNRLQLGLNYSTTTNSSGVVQNYFPLGGFLRMSGLELGEISGPHAALARLVYYRQIGQSTGAAFETPIYFGLSAEAGNVWQQRSDMGFDSMKLNGSVFFGMDSFFGPIYLAAGFAEDGKRNYYLFIGAPPF